MKKLHKRFKKGNRNVLRILGADLKALSRQFFAMAIVIALLFIPALYAWFNIYANWDPYGGTGNITIAVATEDAGYEVDGKMVYKSAEVMQQLAAKDSINFVLYPTVLEALSDCEAGKCYGAIIFNNDFTRNMYDLAHAVTYPESTVTFYENFKLNPVANKITETAASTAVTAVQTAYFQALFQTLFGGLNEFMRKIDLDEINETIIGTLTRVRDASDNAVQMLDKLSEKTMGLADDLRSYDATEAGDDLRAAGERNLSSSLTIGEMVVTYREAMDSLNATVDTTRDAMNTDPSQVTEEWKTEQNYRLQEIIDSTYNMADEDLAEQIRSTAMEAQQSVDSIDTSGSNPEETAETLAGLNTMMDVMTTAMNAMTELGLGFLETMSEMTAYLGVILINAGNTAYASTPMINSAGDTVAALDNTMAYARASMKELSEKLDSLLASVEGLSDSEIIDMIQDLFNSDGSEFAEFLACPVEVVTGEIYSVSSYGTAMAPFYSTLAIWVGCVVLAAVLKTEAEDRGFENVTENELFWSRFLLYLILNEIQAAVIMLGDVYLLGISCQSLPLLLLAGAFTSLVFTLFIYSMVLAFGDIGKAIVVVIMVLQIAGSGGTYPIEILQEIFSKLYLFFPFPYAINAMREAICGTYGNDYWVYIGQLMIYGVIGLAVGLFVRKPFIRVNAFVEEEMKKTGVL